MITAIEFGVFVPCKLTFEIISYTAQFHIYKIPWGWTLSENATKKFGDAFNFSKQHNLNFLGENADYWHSQKFIKKVKLCQLFSFWKT